MFYTNKLWDRHFVLLLLVLLSSSGKSCHQYICSAQTRNRYNAGIVLAQSRNSHFAGPSNNSYLARFDSAIVPVQSRNRGQSKNI